MTAHDADDEKNLTTLDSSPLQGCHPTRPADTMVMSVSATAIDARIADAARLLKRVAIGT